MAPYPIVTVTGLSGIPISQQHFATSRIDLTLGGHMAALRMKKFIFPGNTREHISLFA
jgi:hypothetical protein